MKLIYADQNGIEIGYLHNYSADFDIGDENDFVVTTSTDVVMDNGYKIYNNGSEWGGIITAREVDTRSNTIKYSGKTWRGILGNYVIQPPTGEGYRIVSGSVSSIIGGLLAEFGITSLFTVLTSAATVSNYKFDRYIDLEKAISKMLKSIGYRLNLTAHSGIVTLEAVEIQDLSDQLEYSQDSNIGFRIKQDKGGINHLVCLGAGELEDRDVINLYLQSNGTIGYTQYYTGLSERAAVYDYPNVESIEELEKGGRERFADLRDANMMEMTIENIDVSLGDIIGGRERITGIEMKKPITRMIVQGDEFSTDINYKVG